MPKPLTVDDLYIIVTGCIARQFNRGECSLGEALAVALRLGIAIQSADPELGQLLHDISPSQQAESDQLIALMRERLEVL